MGLGNDRKEILEKYGPYVRSLAATVRKQFNMQLELDELVAYGQVGLLEAADRFDPKVGANFLTFAHYRIKGAIFDGLRKMGVLRGGGDQRGTFVGERSSAYLGNLADREAGGGSRGGSFEDDIRDVSGAVAGLAVVFAASMDAMDGLSLPDESLPADQRLELEQLKKRVRAAITQLPEKERTLLEGYYFQGKTLEEAGAEIGQSKSWASRLHARAVEQLKKMLAEEMELPDEEDADEDSSRRTAHASSSGSSRGRSPTGRAAEASGGSDPAKAGTLKVR